MGIDDSLADRRKALEEQFFRKQEEAAIAKLRAQREATEAKQALAAVSGISDDALLDRLLQLGIGPRAMAAVSLVPLVEVAWADGTLDPAERDAVLAAAKSAGLETGSTGYELLESWLTHRPGDELKHVWVQFTKWVAASMDAADRNRLKSELLGRARRVAEAAGGFLGLGSKVSRAEEAILTQLAAAFEP